MRKINRWLALALAAVMVLGLCACGKPDPTAVPTATPTPKATEVPSTTPTEKPTETPTPTATTAPTAVPTTEPTAVPTTAPTAVPTTAPTAAPTAVPTTEPTAVPTTAPTAVPTTVPTAVPTTAPTAVPTTAPTAVPTTAPTAVPTTAPTAVPTTAPTAVPTTAPTAVPTAVPTAIPTPATLATPVISVKSDKKGLTWTADANALKTQIKVNSDEYKDATEYAFPTGAAEYTVKVKAIGDGTDYLTSAEATYTFTVADTSITMTKTASDTASFTYTGLKLQVKAGESYIDIPSYVAYDSATKTYSYHATSYQKFDLKAVGGWDEATKTFYPEDTFRGIPFVMAAESRYLVEDASVNNTDELLAAAWPDTKYTSGGWVDSNATIAAGTSYKSEYGKCMQFNCWVNGTTFAYTHPISVTNCYSAISADVKGDGFAECTVRLKHTKSGVYAEIKLGTIPTNWTHVVIPMDSTGWTLYYGGPHAINDAETLNKMGYMSTSELISGFDKISFIFRGMNNNKSTVLYADNVYFETEGSGDVTAEQLLFCLDFNDGTIDSAYSSTNWIREKYTGTYKWLSAKNNMNCRPNPNGGKLVNLYASTSAQKYRVYSTSSLGTINKIQFSAGNYHKPSGGTTADILVKIAVIDGSDVKHYILGDADNYYTFAATSTETLVPLSFDTATTPFGTDTRGVYIEVKSTRDNYLYIDDVKLLNASDQTVVSFDFEEGTLQQKYDNAYWQYYGQETWVTFTGGMNSKAEKNNGNTISGTKIVNFLTGYNNTAYRYTYTTGNNLGKFNTFTARVGNYYKDSVINAKVAVLDSQGRETFILGTSSTTVPINVTTGLADISASFTAMDVYGIRLYLKSNYNEATYLYADDITLSLVPAPLTTPVISAKADGTGLEWTTDTNATKYQVKVNDGEYADATSYAFPTAAGSYTIKVKAIGNGKEFADSAEATYTFTAIAECSISATKTAVDRVEFTYVGTGCKYSTDGSTFADLNAVFYDSGLEKYVMTVSQLGTGTKNVTLKAVKGYDATNKKLYIADKTEEVTLYEIASANLVIEDATTNDTDAKLQAAWVVKKASGNTWADTSATITAGNSFASSYGKGMQFNIWNNNTSYKFAKTYSTTNSYAAISMDILGDGIATVSVQLVNSATGVYAHITCGAAANKWQNVVIPMDAAGWRVNYNKQDYTFAQALPVMNLAYAGELIPYFDTINIVFSGSASSGAQTILYADNLEFLPTYSGTSITPTAIDAHVLTFNTATVDQKLENSHWAITKYSSGNFVETGHMYCKNRGGSKVVNMQTGSGVTRMYVYEAGENLGNFDTISMRIGNAYASATCAIKTKIALVKKDGSFVYLLGNASNFVEIPKTTEILGNNEGMVPAIELVKTLKNDNSLTAINFPAMDVYGIAFVVASSQDSYLYIDDIVLSSSTSASPDKTFNFEDGTADSEYKNTAEQKKWKKTMLDMNVKFEKRNGTQLSIQNRVVNLPADTTPRIYTYSTGASLGTFKEFSVSFGCYYNATSIDYMIAVVDTAGQVTYLKGDGTNFETITQNQGLERISCSFTEQEVLMVQICVKASGSTYLYMDDFTLSNAD